MDNKYASWLLSWLCVNTHDIVSNQFKSEKKFVRSFQGQPDAWNEIKDMMKRNGGIVSYEYVDDKNEHKVSTSVTIHIHVINEAYYRKWLFPSVGEAISSVCRLKDNHLFRQFEDQGYRIVIEDYSAHTTI